MNAIADITIARQIGNALLSCKERSFLISFESKHRRAFATTSCNSDAMLMQERSANGAVAWLLGTLVGTLAAAPVASVFVGAFCPLFFGVGMRLECSGSSRFGNIPDLRALLSLCDT